MNSIELITKYSTKAWDQVYKAESRSALLDAPSAQVQFTGAKTVKIAKFSATGLGNYYRNNDGDPRANTASGAYFGYAGGNVGLTWEEFTLKQDRSAMYQIEKFDDEETDGLTLGAATTEINRTIIIPEVDAYCFSEIAKYAESLGGDNVKEVVFDSANHKPLAALNAALLYFDENEVPAEKQIIFVSPKYMTALRNDDGGELNRYLLQSDFKKDVSYTMVSYEGRQLVVVPPSRFKTLIKMTNSGYAWSANSKDIDFMVVAKDAVMHIVKYNKVKVIGGDMNLAGAHFDGFSIFARVYHDVFVPDNKRYALYVHVGGFAEKAKTNVLTIAREGTTVTSINHKPAELKAKYYVTTAGHEVGDEITVGATETAIKVGSTVENNAVVIAVSGGTVIAKTEVK